MPSQKLVSPVPGNAPGPRFATLAQEDHAEILGLIAAYGRYYDDGRVDDFVELFSEDAVFYPNWPGIAPDQVIGKDALREFFSGARAQCDENGTQPRHYATNVIVAAGSAERAEATVSMAYAEWQAGDGAALKMVGQYDYIVEKRAGRWFISQWSMRYDK